MDAQGGMSRNVGPGLYEFLMEAELQQYYPGIRGDLKVQTTAQLKYVTEEDLNAIGMSKPEMRRLKKYFQKHFPQNYLSKFKKMLLPKREEQTPSALGMLPEERQDRPPVRVPNKHMIPADAIIVNKELGTGEFGVVQQGVWTNDGERIQVAIKCLSRERMQNNPIEFLKEAAIMHSIDHEHIVRLYGVVLDTNSLMLVTELAPLRSLLECLKEPSLRASFPVLSLCDFAVQIADGMQYLEAKRLIHRDLAARNILVFSKNKVKISDFGLSRALGVGKDYYQTNFNVNLKLPIAWCAPECISYLKFTSASDVWAYGVTLWEMFSYGFQPWAALTGHQILEAIDEPNFQRLEQPECCPKDYFSLMQQCWQHEPSKRPKFSELINLLPDLKPEQVQAVQDSTEAGQLVYRQGDIITVLDKGSSNTMWKGVLNNGKTGIFNPAHTIAYLGSNLPSNKPGEFTRGDGKNAFSSQRRKIRTDMISSPQGDLKHTGHVGLDGAYFGDISFLGGKYPHLPRQVVTPYKPQEDVTDNSSQILNQDVRSLEIDRETLRDSRALQQEQQSKHDSLWSDVNSEMCQLGSVSNPSKQAAVVSSNPIGNIESLGADHEYHEISDEENQDSPLRFDKTLNFDFGPSLLAEMDQMFRSLGSSAPPPPPGHPLPTEHESSNARNELREIQAKQCSKKKQATATLSEEAKEVYNSLVETPAIESAQDTNPLRMLRSGLPVVRPRVRGNKHATLGHSMSHPEDASSEHAFQFVDMHHGGAKTLPKIRAPPPPHLPPPLPQTRSLERHHSALEIENNQNQSNVDENPIPLPPRDRSKTLQPKSSLPRHQRKHPLIIPGGGVTRTLAKMAVTTPPALEDQVDGNFLLQYANSPTTSTSTLQESYSPEVSTNSPEEFEQRIESELAALDSLPMDESKMHRCSVISEDLLEFSDNLIDPEDTGSCTTENVSEETNDSVDVGVRRKISVESKNSQKSVASKSLEEETETGLPSRNSTTSSSSRSEDSSLSNKNESPSVTSIARSSQPTSARGGGSSSHQKRSFNCTLQIERSFAEESSVIASTGTTTQYNANTVKSSGSDNANRKDPSCCNNDNYLTSNTKSYDREESDKLVVARNSDLSRQSDHVSCEDLLEFACDGPNARRTRGPRNGEQSDEVRIMLKVLHDQSTPESCIAALNVTGWDVLTAIKLERLQGLLKRENNFVGLEDCKLMLSQCGGDVVKAAALLRNTDDTAAV
uniref:activated Cdc42 kinase-like isoform X9 n=1 Tax=Vespula vulgaris TaxID=7454 RepID=UPI00223ADBAE|nr:activated Cdc42 kinase-like isoform X9 [Vespula vulgaris]